MCRHGANERWECRGKDSRFRAAFLCITPPKVARPSRTVAVRATIKGCSMPDRGPHAKRRAIPRSPIGGGQRLAIDAAR